MLRMPPDPPRGSRLRRSYLITPLNKYCCQYEHPSKNLSYGLANFIAFINCLLGSLNQVLVLRVKTRDVFFKRSASFKHCSWLLRFVVFPPIFCQLNFHFAYKSYARRVGTDGEILLLYSLRFWRPLLQKKSMLSGKKKKKKKLCSGVSPAELNWTVHFHIVSWCNVCLSLVCIVSELSLLV